MADDWVSVIGPLLGGLGLFLLGMGMMTDGLKHLDDNVLAVPTLAMDALEREVARIGHLAVQLARSSLAGAEVSALAREHEVVSRLGAEVEAFVEGMNRGAMPRSTAERLARTLRVQRYHETSAEQVLAAALLRPLNAAGPAVAGPHAAFVQRADGPNHDDIPHAH